MNTSNFGNIYDKYCPMLYSIALQICHSRKKAEQTLINTFKKIYNQYITKHQDAIHSTPIPILVILRIIRAGQI